VSGGVNLPKNTPTNQPNEHIVDFLHDHPRFLGCHVGVVGNNHRATRVICDALPQHAQGVERFPLNSVRFSIK
jgi:hypothetical protein